MVSVCTYPWRKWEKTCEPHVVPHCLLGRGCQSIGRSGGLGKAFSFFFFSPLTLLFPLPFLSVRPPVSTHPLPAVLLCVTRNFLSSGKTRCTGHVARHLAARARRLFTYIPYWLVVIPKILEVIFLFLFSFLFSLPGGGDSLTNASTVPKLPLGRAIS